MSKRKLSRIWECNEGKKKNKEDWKEKEIKIELGKGSEVVYIPKMVGSIEGWNIFDYLTTHIPWTRPTIRVFGRSCLQPRDTCYLANAGLTPLVYSGYTPHPYSWDDFPPLKHLLHSVENAVPGSRFNSLLLNRYKDGNDYVGWHSDNESLYGLTPQIASLSLGSQRQFFLKIKKPTATATATATKHSFTLKHGSLLVMRGFTQRDWIHSVPKRAKVDDVRINLTFRLIL